MQTTEQNEQQLSIDPQSHPFSPIPLALEDESDDPEQIFLRAVAGIDTQPLLTPKPTGAFTIGEVLEVCLLVSMLCLSLAGVIWQCLTFPHTLVVVYAKATPAHLTATLDVPTRTVAPVTITRSATMQTTGTGHQDATQATGALTFYNGSSTPQYAPGGSVFTGTDGVKVTIDQSITVPAANLPAIGRITIPSTAMLPGHRGNIAAFDINSALSTDVKVRNEVPFSKGRDARTYRAVAAQDLTTVTNAVNDTLTQAFTTAFSLQPGEAALPTNCHVTTSANQQVAEEAQSVTLTASKTCSAVAYNQDELTRAAIATFTKTRPGAPYHIVGSMQTNLISASPLTVSLNGKWAYTFSQDYEQLLAQGIQGESPAKARAYLLKTGIISYASVPQTLPSAGYIDFLVLVG